MAKKLTPELMTKLEENSNLLSQKGASQDEIQQMAYAFVEQFGVDDSLDKKKSVATPLVGTSSPTSDSNTPLVSPLLKQTELNSQFNQMSFRGDVPEQPQYSKKEKIAAFKKAYKNQPFAPSVSDNDLELIAESSVSNAPKLSNNLTEKVKQKEAWDNFIAVAPASRIIEERQKLVLQNPNNINEIAQSRLGKTADYLDGITKGNDIDPEDLKYLKEVAPKASNELIPEGIDLQTSINNNREKYQEQQAKDAVAYSEAQRNFLLKLNVVSPSNPIDISDGNVVSSLSQKQELQKENELKAIELKYPKKTVGYPNYGNDFQTTTEERPQSYYNEVLKLNEKYNAINSSLGAVHATAIAIKSKDDIIAGKKSLDDVGEESLKYQNSSTYKLFKGGGSQSEEVKATITKLGIEAFRQSGISELNKIANTEESSFYKKYPKQLDDETLKRLSQEYFKQTGLSYVYNQQNVDVSALDKIANNLPSIYKQNYYNRLRKEAVDKNKKWGDMSPSEDTPRIKLMNPQGAINQLVNEFVLTSKAPINGVIKLFTSKEKIANEVLSGIDIHDQAVFDEEQSKATIEALNEKIKTKPLTYEELNQYNDARSTISNLPNDKFLGIIPVSYNFVNKSAGVVGMVASIAMQSYMMGGVANSISGVVGGATVEGLSILQKTNATALEIEKYVSVLNKIQGTSGALTMGVNMMGEQIKRSVELMPDDNQTVQRGIYTALMTSAWALASRIMPLEKVFSKITPNVEQQLVNLAEGISEKKISEELAKTTLQKIMENAGLYVKDVATNTAKVTAEMGAIETFKEYGVESWANTNWNAEHANEAIKHVLVNTPLDMLVVNVIGGAARWGNSRPYDVKNIAALGDKETGDRFIDIINAQRDKGNISEEVAIKRIKIVSTLQDINKTEMPKVMGIKKLTQNEQDIYSIQLLNEKILSNAIDNTTDKVLINKYIDKISESQDIRDKILGREVVVTPDYNIITVDEANNQVKNEQEKVNQTPTAETASIEKPSMEKQLEDVNAGRTASFTYNNESEVPEIFKDKISSSGEKNGVPFVKVTVAQSLADYELNKNKKSEPTNNTPALKDVESTTKALQEIAKNRIPFTFTSIDEFGNTKTIELNKGISEDNNGFKLRDEEGGSYISINSISKQYHQAKADGSNPELVKSVEQTLKETENTSGSTPPPPPSSQTIRDIGVSNITVAATLGRRGGLMTLIDSGKSAADKQNWKDIRSTSKAVDKNNLTVVQQGDTLVVAIGDSNFDARGGGFIALNLKGKTEGDVDLEQLKNVLLEIRDMAEEKVEGKDNYDMQEIQEDILNILKSYEERTPTPQETTKAGSVGVVEDAEYNDFIDKGKVSEARLNNIANKVKNQEPLSDREKEIFSDKTSEINKIIANQASSVGVGGDVKQKELENKIDEINKKRTALRGEDGAIPTDKMGEWNKLGKELNEAKAAAKRGNSNSSILIKKRGESETSDPTFLSKEEKEEAADLIEQVIQNSKTVEEAVKKVNRLGYVFDLANADLFAMYLSDRYNSDAPQVGNNKSSFQDWVNGKQSLKETPKAGSVGVDVDVESNLREIAIAYDDAEVKRVMAIPIENVIKEVNNLSDNNSNTKIGTLNQGYANRLRAELKAKGIYVTDQTKLIDIKKEVNKLYKPKQKEGSIDVDTNQKDLETKAKIDEYIVKNESSLVDELTPKQNLEYERAKDKSEYLLSIPKVKEIIDKEVGGGNKTSIETKNEPITEQPKQEEELPIVKIPITERKGETLTVNVGGKAITGIVEVDEGGKATITSGNKIIELRPDQPYVDYESPVRLADNIDGIQVNGEVYSEVRFDKDEKGNERAVLVKEDGSIKLNSTPSVIEELKYQSALHTMEQLSEQEAEQILKQNERKGKTTQTTQEGVSKTDGTTPTKSEQEIRLQEAVDEINLIEQTALEDLKNVEIKAKLIQHENKKTYLVEKKEDGTYEATLNGRMVRKGNHLNDLIKKYESQTKAESDALIPKLQKQVNELKKEVENKLFGEEKKIGNDIVESVNIELSNNKIKGRLLNEKQSEELQKEIESKYSENSTEIFNKEKDDIRKSIFNYENPIAEKTSNGVNLRITNGLVRENKEGDKENTYLLYADGKVVGEFYSVNDAKTVIKYIEDNLVKSIPTQEIKEVSGNVETPPTNSDGGRDDVEAKQQIENFGVAPNMVEPVHSVISRMFDGLKKAGLTTAKTIGEWVGISKGTKEKGSLFQTTVYGKSKIEKRPSFDLESADEAIKSGRVKIISPIESLEESTFAFTFWDDLFVGDIFHDNKKIASFDGGVFYPLNGGEKGKMGASVSEGSAGSFSTQANRSLFINNGIKLPEVFNEGSFVVKKGSKINEWELTHVYGTKTIVTLPKNPKSGIVVIGKGSDIKHKTSLSAKIGFVNTLLSYAKDKEGYDGLLTAIKKEYNIGNVKNADKAIEYFNEYLKGGRSSDALTLSDADNSYKNFRAALVKDANPLLTKLAEEMGITDNKYFDGTQLKKGIKKISNEGIDKIFADLGQEDFLKGLTNGDAYAALKITSPVFFEKDLGHPSYPYAIKTIDGSPIGVDVFNKTFRAFGENQGVDGRSPKEGQTITGSFGTTTTTKPSFKLKKDIDLNHPSSIDLSGALGQYESIRRTKDLSTGAIKVEKASGSTQRAITTGSYIKVANMAKELGAKSVLDYGAGFGLGSDAMAEIIPNVESFEPNYENWKGKNKPTFTNNTDINKKYDAVVSLNVLNVVPKETRDAIVKDIYNKLNTNGSAIISTRGWTGDIKEGSGRLGEENNSRYILSKQDGKNVERYQKGFDGNELVDYVKEVLGDNVTVKKDNSFGKAGVIITKTGEYEYALKQKANAQYRIENGKNIVEAIQKFNGKPKAVVAITHEIMHPTVVAIIDGAKEGNEVGAKHTQTIVDEFNKANPNSAVTIEDLIAGNDAFKEGTTSKQYRSVQEFIAESWEKYHTEGGKGFSEAFQKVLDQITKAFQSVYKSLSGNQLTPELRKMFDEILGKEQSLKETTKTGSVGVGGDVIKDDKGVPVSEGNWYHGSPTEGISGKDLKPNEKGLIFFTRDKGIAERYATNDYEGNTTSTNVFERKLEVNNIFDPEKNSDNAEIIDLLSSKGNFENAGRNADFDALAKEALENGEWSVLETKEFIDGLKKLGYDAIYIDNRPYYSENAEGKRTFSRDIAVFDTKQHKAVEQSLKETPKSKQQLVEEDYELSRDNQIDAEYDIQKGLGFRIGNNNYERKGDAIIRVKNHTPDWSNFNSDLENDPSIKKVINVTVGDYENSDSRRNKGSLEQAKKEYPNVEFIDVKVKDGESINEAIQRVSEIVNSKTATPVSKAQLSEEEKVRGVGGEVEFGTAFNMQDATAENTVGKEKDLWGKAQVWRERIENAGDILRELSSRGDKPDVRYLMEKVKKLRDWITESKKGYTPIDRSIKTIEDFEKTNLKWSDAVDSREYIEKFHSPVLDRIKSEYEAIPTYTKEQRLAVDLVLDLINNNIKGLESKLNEIETISTQIKTDGTLPIIADIKLGKAVEQPLKETPIAGVVGGEVKDYKGIFNPKKTGISGLDVLIKDDGYNYFYKGVSGEVVMMSPDQYLKRVREGLKTKENANIIEDKKNAINEAINEGNKIDMPFISTKDGKFSQEGRNRAVVARERGEKLIPVFIEKDVSFDDKIAKGQEYINSAIKDGATTKEEVISKLEKQGLHRDAIRFIDNNFDNETLKEANGGVIDVKSNKDISKVFNRLLKDEHETDDYGIYGLLADWGAEYNPNTEKLEWIDTRSGTGKQTLSKKEFINDILNGKLEKEVPSAKEFIDKIKKSILDELGIKEEAQNYLDKTMEESPIITLDKVYEEIQGKKSEKSKKDAKERIINDNFEELTQQLITNKKIKRIC